MTAAEYKLRTVIILVLLMVWAAGAAAKVYVYAVRDQESLLAQSRRIAWRSADIPAQRGRIIDRNGVILARDVFTCDLVLNVLPEKQKRKNHLLNKLREVLRDPLTDLEKQTMPAVLKSNLTAEEIVLYTEKFRRYPEIRTEGHMVRQYHGEPGLREVLGETALNDRQECVGISGLEKEHDLKLSGSPGRLKVMLDRNGSWISETLRVVRQPVNGQDVKLNASLAELREQGKAAGNEL